MRARSSSGAGLVVAGLLALALSAGAEPPANLSGKWRTLAEESEPMDPVMEVQGVSWLQRQAARMVTLEFVFRQNGIELEQELQSSFVSNARTYRMNGPEYDDEDFRGHRMRARDWWTEAGDFVRRMVYETGTVLTVRRSLRADGRHIDVLFEIEQPEREKRTVRRVLRRVEDRTKH
jgi:hypothetical protein